jgi:hypothetical protein
MVDQERRKVLQYGLAAAVVPLVRVAPAVAEDTSNEDARTEVSKGPDAPLPVELGAKVSSGPLALMAPHVVGSDLGRGWTLLDLRAPDRGAMLLSLKRAADGAMARVHLCRNAGCPAGIASTDKLDFILMNGGGGDEASDEELGLVLLKLATVVAANEAEVDLKGLQTHEERIEHWLQAGPGALL